MAEGAFSVFKVARASVGEAEVFEKIGASAAVSADGDRFVDTFECAWPIMRDSGTETEVAERFSLFGKLPRLLEGGQALAVSGSLFGIGGLEISG